MDLDEITVRAQARVGTSLRGKYLLERLLGVGAMGAVYECTHRNGMRAAVKVLHREIATIAEVKHRFLREGRIVNRIQHPGVVRVFDDDEDVDGTAFLVMELLEGRTVETEFLAAGRRLHITRVVQIVDSLLDVLDAAHAVGVVHRDIKPDNLFLTPGALKVLDFGIARLADSTSTTKSGQMMGTPEFVAPEQAAGRIRDIDSRTDIFSVAAMMFTLLSGQFVQKAKGALEYMVFAATKPARLTFSVLPNIEPEIAHVIDTALAFEKEKRWASAKEMQRALRSASAALEPTMAAGAQLPAALREEYERRQAAKRAVEAPTEAPPPPAAPPTAAPPTTPAAKVWPQVSSTQTLPFEGAPENEPIPLKRK